MLHEYMPVLDQQKMTQRWFGVGMCGVVSEELFLERLGQFLGRRLEEAN